MEYIEKLLEKLRELSRKVIEALLGSAPKPELIPVPVKDSQRRAS